MQMVEWETQCRGCLPYGSLLGFRIDGPDCPEQLLEACVSCKAIRAYNMDTHESTIVYKKSNRKSCVLVRMTLCWSGTAISTPSFNWLVRTGNCIELVRQVL